MEEEDEELQMKSLVQKRKNLDGGEASKDLESSIQSARGSGQSLDTDLQIKMGQAMGADFSSVKVHTDSHADQLNKSIQAKAFTTGSDIFFSTEEYKPDTVGGQNLLAHELTHVIQQGATAEKSINKQSKFMIGSANNTERISPVRIQRRLDEQFKSNEIEKFISTKAKMNKSLLSQIVKALKTYEEQLTAKGQLNSLLDLKKLVNTWFSKTRKRIKPDKFNKMKGLQNAIYIELPKVQEKADYMNDLLGGQKNFDYMSNIAATEAVSQASSLAAGNTNEKTEGQKKAALELMKMKDLSDVEIAAIKIYTVDDYKYINPSLAGKDDWLEASLPNIKGLNEKRRSVAVISEKISTTFSRKDKQNQSHVWKTKIYTGKFALGYGVQIIRDAEPVGQGHITSIDPYRLNDNDPTATQNSRVFSNGEEVSLQIDNFDTFQKGDQLHITDTSKAGSAKAKAEGLRHGKIANEGLAKLDDYKKPVYRGMTIKKEDLAKYQNGMTIDYPNLTSTTKNYAQSEKFITRELNKDKATGKGDKVGLFMTLKIEKMGKDVSDLSLIEDEAEVLLMPGTKFIVVNAPTLFVRNNYYGVELKQVE